MASLFQEETTNTEKPKKENKLLKPLLVILAVILFAGGTGLGAWWWQNGELNKQRSDNDTRVAALQKQINDLQKKSTTTTSTTKPNDSAATIQSTTLEIPELAIKITLPTNIADTRYAFNQQTMYANLSTSNLASLGGNRCGTNAQDLIGPIGSVIMSKTPPSQTSGGDAGLGLFIKQVPGDGRYLYYKSPQYACSETASSKADKAQTDAIAAIQEALKTAATIQK